MNSFARLSSIQHTFNLTLFLFLLLIYIHMFSFILLRTKRRINGIIALLNIFINFIILSALTSYIQEVKLGKTPGYISYYLANLQIEFYYLVLAMGYLLALYLLYKERLYQKNIINRLSIKEAIDNLPTGLSFAYGNGNIILINWQIERLCHKITGKGLRNSNIFWKMLEEGQIKEGNQLLTKGVNPTVKLEDGRTWSFKKNAIKIQGEDIIEISAIDITDLNILRDKLEEDNKSLREMGLRIKELTRVITETKAREERFATKMRIHDDMGYALMATRQYIRKENWGLDINTQAQEIFDLWKYNIGILLGSNSVEKKPAIESFVSAARTIGIDVKINGHIPDSANEINLILQIAGESLTNAVRHARSTELYIEIRDNENRYDLIISNNGLIPKEKIVEGGGLSSLRRKIEEIGGDMEIKYEPMFTLNIAIPKEGGVSYG